MPRIPIRAAVLDGPGQPLRIDTLYIDEPGPGEVLVRSGAAGLCHSDLKYLTGDLAISTPAVLGHETSGVVEHIGAGVTRFSVGDQVVATVTPNCGACASCVSGRPTQCQRVAAVRQRDEPRLIDGDGRAVTTLGGIGAFSEAILVPEAALAAVTHELDAHLACLLGCCISTGVGAVVHGAKVSPMDTVAVIGCGGVGMAAVQGSRIAGARRVIAIDVHRAKLDLALKLGATDVVLASSPNVLSDVLAICPEGVSHAFEAVGTPETAELAFSLLAPAGTATILGLMVSGSRITIDAERLVEGDRRMQGAYMGASQFIADLAVLVDHARSGRLDLAAMVTSTVPLRAINEGFDSMKDPATIRTVVDFNLGDLA